MKQRVKLSTYSIIISIAGIAILVALMIFELRQNHDIAAYFIAAGLVILSVAALIYAPMSISADIDTLSVNRLLRDKSIPLANIKSIELCPPTMSEKRICGSGGWFGYWGWMSEPSIGKYFAYYGKASDCFLVRLKNGRQYMLGCENPATMVEFIKSRM